jgi:hypothetical protein
MLLSDLANFIAKKQGISEDLIAVDLLKHQILAYNAVVIKQQYDKSGLIAESLSQTIRCVNVNKVNSAACGLGVDNDFVLRTSSKVPKPLILKRRVPFLSVYNTVTSSKRVSLDYISPNELEYIQDRRFTKNNMFYTYENDYVYIVNALEKGIDLNTVSIRAIWDNPLEVKLFAENEKITGCNQLCQDCSNEESTCFQDGDYNIASSIEGLILSFFLNDNINKAE